LGELVQEATMRGTKIERSPGVWRLRVYIGDDPATGNPRQVSRTFRGTKKQADTALNAFVTEVVNGNAVTTSSSTVSDYLNRWLTHITPSRSPTTIRGYRFKIKRISAKVGHHQVDKLTAQHLDRAYREWLDEGLDPSSVHHLHRVLSAALRQAVKWGIVQSAPTSRATPPHRRHHPQAIPAPGVIQRLVTAAEDRGQPVLAISIALAATTGLRRGELTGLRWSDIDLGHGRLYVRRSIKMNIDGGWITGPTKTHQARTIALDAFTVAVLHEHRARAEEWAHDANTELAEDGYALTLDPTGTQPMKPDSLGQAFGRLCEHEGIEGLTLHSLRHFSASMLIASGRDVRTIAGRLGHSDATTTLRVYAHMVEGRDQDAADFLGGLIAPAQPAALDKG
jgi:integrase